MPEWIDRPLPEIAQALRKGILTARDLTDEAIARHDKWDLQLGAYKTWDAEYARRQAAASDAAFTANKDLGLAQGIPFSVKDIYGAEGFPIYAGSPKRLPPEWEKNGPILNEVRQQLAVIPGKTHTVEFAFGGIGTNAHWDVPRNPWDAQNHRAPGGSSSGAGVSLWEGSASIAFGTDTGGSVRVPASMTGNVGLKTTKGRWSTDLITILSTSFDTPGILAKSVTDISFGFNAIDPAAKANGSPVMETREINGLNLGITQDYFWDRCSDDVGETVENAIAELKNAGAKTSTIKIPEAGTSVQVWGEGTIVASEGYSFLQTYLPDWIDSLDPNVLSRMEVAKEAKTLDYFSALFKISELSASVHSKLENVDALAVPTVPITPPKIRDLVEPEAYKKNNLLSLSNTMPGNVLVTCAITIPAGLDKSGMPVGLQLITLPNREEELISLALGIEKILGTPRDRLGTPPLGGRL